MGNKLTIFSVSGFLLLCAMVLPFLAHASSIGDVVTQRLCDRQASLIGRLVSPLISPSLCGGTPPPPAPTLTLSATPMIITAGGSSNLAWVSTNATSCTASEGWSGAKTTSGNTDVSPTVNTTYTLMCSGAGGNVTKSATVSVTPVTPQAATLTLIKSVINDNGGTTTPSAWTLSANGATPISGASGSGSVTNASVTPGSYDLTESGGPSGYTSDGIYVCQKNGGPDVGGNTVVLANGDSAVCTITNNDQSATLIVKKWVIRDDGGTAATSTFSFQIDGGNATAFEADGQNDVALNAGTHSITEPATAGYTATYGNCSNVFIPNGGTATCTITNNDVAPDAPTVDLVATPTSVTPGAGTATTTLTWTTTNAASCTASGGTFTGSKTVNNSEIVTPTATTTYQLDCSGPGGNASDTATVNFVPTPEPAQTIGHLVISEVQYDVASTTVSGSENFFEWMELYNGSNSAVDLQGWSVGDAPSTDSIAASTLVQPGQFVVIVASTSPNGIPAGVLVVVLHSSIGFNGFGNDGDGAVLLDPGDATIDQVGYGTNVTVAPNVSIPGTHDGHSIKRAQLTSDTDTAVDWADTNTPTPGQ